MSQLLNREPEELFAVIHAEAQALGASNGSVTVARFLAHVDHIAQQLPLHAPYAINLCENRYLFTVAFCAAIVRGQCNLLPQNRGLDTQQALADNYANAYVIHDGIAQLLPEIHSVNLRTTALPAQNSQHTPIIDDDQLAAIAFTSGSTGIPTPNLKHWRTLTESTKINAQSMLATHLASASILTTVPAQHMWGLETTTLMPLRKDVSFSSAKPLFPKDIALELEKLAAPRILVSTPIHLRALINSGLEFPPVERILCATAPLSNSLAERAEKLLGGELLEVFGCSEVGSMACRRAAQVSDWRLFDGLRASMSVDHPTTISAPHLPADVELQDVLKMTSEYSFKITGRSGDIINVAGKRDSLLELNKTLLDCDGVDDGAVFLTDSHAELNRPIALVVANKDYNKQAIVQTFQKRHDPIFTPRPIIEVPSLPREENGKLKRAKLLEFYQSLRV